MISSDVSDRCNWIGGSEASYVDRDWNTTTFVEWWKKKLIGVVEDSYRGKYHFAGTILESEILKMIGVDVDSPQHIKEGTIARGNLDGEKMYVVNTVIESKTAMIKRLLAWVKSGKVDIGYRRQVKHYMYVSGLDRAEVWIYATKQEEIENPMGAKLDRSRLFKFEMSVDDFDMEDYDLRIRYLTKCFNEKTMPINGAHRLLVA